MKIENCEFTGNYTDGSDTSGGAIFQGWHGGSASSIKNSVFSDNRSWVNGHTAGGGGALQAKDSVDVINCLFYDNFAKNGGAIDSYSGSLTLINCTFYDNYAYDARLGRRGEGAAVRSSDTLYAYNCIFWDILDDDDSYADEEIYNDGGTATVTYSDVQGGYSGTGNINSDPNFVLTGNDPYSLDGTNSPCLDTGDKTLIDEDYDLDGNTREVDGDCDDYIEVDMGAYEYQSGC